MKDKILFLPIFYISTLLYRCTHYNDRILLVPCCQACTESSASVLNEAPFTGQMVSQALYGLQLMNSRHGEVQVSE